MPFSWENNRDDMRRELQSLERAPKKLNLVASIQFDDLNGLSQLPVSLGENASQSWFDWFNSARLSIGVSEERPEWTAERPAAD